MASPAQKGAIVRPFQYCEWTSDEPEQSVKRVSLTQFLGVSWNAGDRPTDSALRLILIVDVGETKFVISDVTPTAVRLGWLGLDYHATTQHRQTYDEKEWRGEVEGEKERGRYKTRLLLWNWRNNKGNVFVPKRGVRQNTSVLLRYPSIPMLRTSWERACFYSLRGFSLFDSLALRWYSFCPCDAAHIPRCGKREEIWSPEDKNCDGDKLRWW